MPGGNSPTHGGDDASERFQTRVKAGLLLAVIAGAVALGYWRLQPEKPDVHAPVAVEVLPDSYPMKCKACKAAFELKRSDFTSAASGELGQKCPKCGSMNTEPDNSKMKAVGSG